MISRKFDTSQHFKVNVQDKQVNFHDIISKERDSDSAHYLYLRPSKAGSLLLTGRGLVGISIVSPNRLVLQWPAFSWCKGLFHIAMISLMVAVAFAFAYSIGSVAGLQLFKRSVIVLVCSFASIFFILRFIQELVYPARCIVSLRSSGEIHMQSSKSASHWPSVGVARLRCDCHAVMILRYETPLLLSIPFYRGPAAKYIAALVSMDGYLFQIAESSDLVGIIAMVKSFVSSHGLLSRVPMVDRARDVSLVVGEFPS